MTTVEIQGKKITLYVVPAMSKLEIDEQAQCLGEQETLAMFFPSQAVKDAWLSLFLRIE